MAHEEADTYMLQVLDEGIWKDVDWTTKKTAAKEAKLCAKNTGKAHRVINMKAKDYVYVEITVI